MSKYIKLEDAIEAKCPVEDIWEDCINCPLDNNGSEPCKMGKWLKSLPTIEVSENNQVLYGNEHNCIMTLFGECSYSETGCGDCAVVEKVRDALVKTQIETQNSNKNSNVISVCDGVSEAVRCAICNNPNQSYKGCDGACSYDEKLYKRIIDAINASKVEVNEDAISRATVLEIYSDLYWMDERLLNFKDELDKVYEKLRNVPSVIPKAKEGEWIADRDSYDTGCYTCSNCGVYWQFTDDTRGSAYCPNCGAKMKGAEDD